MPYLFNIAELLDYASTDIEQVNQEFPSDSVVLKKELAKPAPFSLAPVSIKLNPIDLGPAGLLKLESDKGKSGESPSFINNYNTQNQTINNTTDARVSNSNKAVNTTDSRVTNSNQNLNSTSDINNGEIYQINEVLNNINSLFSMIGEPVENSENTELAQPVTSQNTTSTSTKPLYKSSKAIKDSAKIDQVNQNFTQLMSPTNLINSQQSDSVNSYVDDLNSVISSLNLITNTEISDNLTNSITNNQSSTQIPTVKTGKLAQSSAIKSAMEPDQTLSNQVGQLTKVLPDTINNLSTNITSLNRPADQTSTSITNQGAKIDQSTNNTNINNTEMSKSGQYTETAKPGEISHGQADFYLQAIYMALISGKLKVKLDYQ